MDEKIDPLPSPPKWLKPQVYYWNGRKYNWMKAQFTTGPWEARTFEVTSFAAREPQLHSHIAKDGVALNTQGEIGRANCLLMAAAPELYAALEEIVDNARKNYEGSMDIYPEAIENARNALAKARGEEA